MWESDLSDKIILEFFQAEAISVLMYGCTIWTSTKRLENKLDVNYTRVLCVVLTNLGSSSLQNSGCITTYLPSQKLSK